MTQLTWPTSVSHNGQTITIEDFATPVLVRLGGKGLGVVKQLVNIVYAKDARLLEDGVVDTFCTGQRTGMTRRCRRTTFGSTTLNDENRGGFAAAGDFLDGVNKLWASSEFLEVDHNDLE